MHIETTYSLYTAIFSATEKAGPLAQTGDADALEVMGRLVPVAELLSQQLREKLASAIAELETTIGAESRLQAAQKPSSTEKNPSQRQRSKQQRVTCRLRAS